ncbi:MAG TPA: lipoyl(octanoyl) transferase LipB [Thiotrichaceae bacterium]|nr:lipoyl(octanoyl) transferase LipB [Thiotrichaceae bacterium]
MGVVSIGVIDLGIQDYEETYRAMREFNEQRDASTEDQIWLLEHKPVYTLGLTDKTEHLLNTADIPVIKTDRGGQVTYHGPGQLIAYLLIDLKRRPYAIKKLVSLMESAVIEYLHDCGIKSERKSGAPGVYVGGEKIAALGVRVKKGCTYHGLALNIDMDLKPFTGINPCGYEGLICTQLINYKKDMSVTKVKKSFSTYLVKHLDQSDNVLSDVA